MHDFSKKIPQPSTQLLGKMVIVRTLGHRCHQIKGIILNRKMRTAENLASTITPISREIYARNKTPTVDRPDS